MDNLRQGVWLSPYKPKEVRMMLQDEKRDGRTVEVIGRADAGVRTSHVVRQRPATGGGLVRSTSYPEFAPDLRYTVAGKGSNNGSCTPRTPAQTNLAKTGQVVKSR